MKSVFWEVYNAGQDESLIQLCGFHKAGFDSLLDLFSPTYERYTPHGRAIRPVKKKAGRNRLLNSAACLGLVLTWLRSRGGNKFLFVLCSESFHRLAPYGCNMESVC